MNPLRRMMGLAINFIFPPVCAYCKGKLDDTRTPICSQCWDSLEKVDLTETSISDPEDSFSILKAVYRFNDCFQCLVHLLKYDHKRSIGNRLGKLLWMNVGKDFFNGIDLIVPVPIHHTRKRERGYNQAELIGETLSECSGISMKVKLLIRTRKTNTQTALTRGERSRNIGKAFKVRGNVKGLRVLLVDDVFTTGATVNECAKALMEAGAAEVRVLAAARV